MNSLQWIQKTTKIAFMNLNSFEIAYPESYPGTEKTQNTWMDAKIGNLVVTPRNGKVVEINALWYNALKTLEALAKKFGDKTGRVAKKIYNAKLFKNNQVNINIVGDYTDTGLVSISNQPSKIKITDDIYIIK